MLRTFDFEKMPIVEIVNDILVDSAKRGASDIHFDPHEDFMKIRIRIDGALHDYAQIPNAVKKNLTTRIKIISGMNITESRLPQDGAIKATLKDMDLDLRVSVLPLTKGEKIVIRILDYTRSLSGLESLDFSEDNYKKVLHMIEVPNGIVLITGATGSGKSTTVYSILQRLNKEETNIITVEDPVEMAVEGINQVQTNSEIGLTFAAALRSILRQDPNIVMIGEIRDTETAKIAVRASITGHLVLSTLHTNNALNTIERLLDMEVERYLLSSALTGIVSQKLARRLCTKCKKLRLTNEYEKDIFRRVLGKEVNEIYSAEGCEACTNGYKGRIAIHEVVLINQDIRDALSSGISKEELRHLVYKGGSTTLLQDGLQKVVEGATTCEEILKLIELEDDDKATGKSDLKSAIEVSTFAKEEKVLENEADIIKHQGNIKTESAKQEVKAEEPVKVVTEVKKDVAPVTPEVKSTVPEVNEAIGIEEPSLNEIISKNTKVVTEPTVPEVTKEVKTEPTLLDVVTKASTPKPEVKSTVPEVNEAIGIEEPSLNEIISKNTKVVTEPTVPEVTKEVKTEPTLLDAVTKASAPKPEVETLDL